MPEVSPSRYLVQAGWDHVPHLDEQTKRELLASTPPHLRDARTQGIPSLGSGAIYPIGLEEILVKPFAIPAYWPRAYALDVGWRKTAALWGAKDPSDGTLYLYAEYYRGQEKPAVHADAIKARGSWLRGAIDPAARNRGQEDGKQLLAAYKASGLNLVPAINAVESGLYEVWRLLSIGRIKVFTTLQNFQSEYRMYRRDEKGRVVKEFDHLMDDLRYLVMTWDAIASVQRPDLAIQSGHSIADSQAGY